MNIPKKLKPYVAVGLAALLAPTGYKLLREGLQLKSFGDISKTKKNTGATANAINELAATIKPGTKETNELLSRIATAIAPAKKGSEASAKHTQVIKKGLY